MSPVLPAYAGMIPERVVAKDPVTGAPRVCGDDPTVAQSASGHGSCSPRMRG